MRTDRLVPEPSVARLRNRVKEGVDDDSVGEGEGRATHSVDESPALAAIVRHAPGVAVPVEIDRDQAPAAHLVGG